MSQPALDLIAFDADDTLWHNERSYRDARERFCYPLMLITKGQLLHQTSKLDRSRRAVNGASMTVSSASIGNSASSM